MSRAYCKRSRSGFCLFVVQRSYSRILSTLGWDAQPGSNSDVRNSSANRIMCMIPRVNAPKQAMLQVVARISHVFRQG